MDKWGKHDNYILWKLVEICVEAKSVDEVGEKR